jgi:outer membrane protein OmpA-like peptidoglycan-associated protein
MNVSYKTTRASLLVVTVAAILSGCASTPDRIDELEAARAIVPQVESSPRAGVAAKNISEARKYLDAANAAAKKGQEGDAKFNANLATAQAQIANEKILTAQAQESIEKGKIEREKVLAEARSLEAERAKQQAQAANQRALSAEEQAAMLAQRSQNLEQQAQSLEQQLKDLQMKRTERGLVLTLGDVLFDTGKSSLKPGAYGTIDRLAAALKDVPTRSVMIEGHTDSVGSEEYNQSLSEQRAAAVQSALLQRGVDSSQVKTAGMGEGLPVAGNDSPSGRQQNRRVEVIFNEGQPRTASDTD